MNRKGFTLIELILVMSLLSLLALLLIGNLNTSLKKGRDAQRKNDLNQIQKSLEIYYEDNQKYPPYLAFSDKFCSTDACSTTDTIYMVKLPKDPTGNYVYTYISEPTGAYYYLYSYIENDLDQGAAVSKAGFTTNASCGASDEVKCRYYVSSSNAPQLTPSPL